MTLRQHSIASVIACLFVILCADAVSAQRQTGPGPQGRAGGAGARGPSTALRAGPAATAILEGRIIAADTGEPVRGADIRLVDLDEGLTRSGTTDAEGRFEITELTPKGWVITVAKGGFITQRSGQRRPSDNPEPVQLANGRRTAANFALVRGGVVAGRVVDEFGDPVAGARVQVLRTRIIRGRRQLSPVGLSDQTDDTGSYRIYALPPGSYYVGANLRAAPPENANVELVAGVTNYYPGTPDLSAAQRVRLGPGEEQQNITIQLVPFRTVRLSGSVISAAGTAAEGASVNLISTSDLGSWGFPLGNFGMTRPGGAFTIVNVSPGSYMLTARLAGDGAADSEQGLVPITVTGDDISGVSVTTSRGVTIKGTVAAAPGSAPLPPALAVRVAARSLTGALERELFHELQRDRTFTIEGLWGPIAIEVAGVPDGWMVRSVVVNDVDVTDRSFEVGSAGSLSARIVLTDRASELNGVVLDGDRPAANIHVVLFPADQGRWDFPSRFVRAALTDAEGRFSIGGLPSDERYLVVAVDNLDADEHGDRDFLLSVQERASAVALAEGERRSVSLPLTSR